MHKRNLFILNIIILLGQVYSCSDVELPELVQKAYKELPTEVDFNHDIKPILSDKCFMCHGPDKSKVKARLQLHLAELAFAELEGSPGKFAIKPGNLNDSQLIHRILSEDPEIMMPETESHLKLSNHEKALLVKWISDGAKYQEHWSFTKPQTPKLPEVKFKEKVANPIDNFILAKLETENMQPSPKAEKEILLRRVSFDLTGLPPTLKDIEAFLDDGSADAYEKQVDRLLASPHY